MKILKQFFRSKRKINRNILEETILKAEFPFIREDCFLIAQVNQKTGQQQLIIQKRNPITNEIEIEDKIICIHTVICDITPEYIEEGLRNGGFQKEILRIRTKEQLKEINLDPVEKFKAFKSWVAGISDAGLDAFKIQAELDKLSNIIYPITYPLLKFMIKVDPEFIFEYLDKIEKECVFEGVLHEVSLIANLEPILEALWELYVTNKMDINPFLERIIDINPPIAVFEKKKYNIFVIEDVFQKYKNFKTFLTHRDIDLRGFAIVNEINRIKNEINEITLDNLESAKRMAELFHKIYLLEQELDLIEKNRNRNIHKSLVKLNRIILKNKEILKKLPISFELENYNARNGDLNLILYPFKDFELDFFKQNIIENIIRKFLQNFSIRKIYFKLGEKIKIPNDNIFSRLIFNIKYKMNFIFNVNFDELI